MLEKRGHRHSNISILIMPSNKSKQSSSAKKGHKNDVERKVYYMSPESYIGEGGSGKPEGGTGKVSTDRMNT